MPPGNETVVDEGPAWISKDFLAGALTTKGGRGAHRVVNVLSWHIEPATSKGDNFLSMLFRVRVEYRESADSPAHTVRLIVKAIPQHGDFLQQFIRDAGFFSRETKAYREALPRLYRFAAARAAGGGGPPFSPRCYHTTRPDTIVLDDLSAQGFKMANRRDMLDLAHCRLVLSRLARLHAVSFVYSAHQPAFLSCFEDIYNEKNRETMRKFLEPQMECLVDIIKTWPNFENIVTKISQAIPGAVDRLIHVCCQENSPWKVLNHGDCWVNNIMFKYSEKGEVVDLRFIDFQLTRFASPACDLTYFLYTSLQNELRVKYMDELIVYYCEAFWTTARSMGFKGQLITIQEMQQEMKRVMFFAFTSSVGTLATALADPEEVMDLSEMTADGLSSNEEVNPFVKLLSTPKFREVLQQMLPFFDKMKIFD